MTVTEYNHSVDEWADSLYRFAAKILTDMEEAHDIVQQSFETLWIKYNDVPLEKAKSFLFTVAHRRCMDVFRKRKVFVPPEHIEHLSAINEDYDLKQYLEKAIKTLDQQSQTLIYLKDYEGYNYKEISSITGLTLEQVKVYLHRARKALKNYLAIHKQTF